MEITGFFLIINKKLYQGFKIKTILPEEIQIRLVNFIYFKFEIENLILFKANKS